MNDSLFFGMCIGLAVWPLGWLLAAWLRSVREYRRVKRAFEVERARRRLVANLMPQRSRVRWQ